jgi:hypothetical protein
MLIEEQHRASEHHGVALTASELQELLHETLARRTAGA